MERHGTHLTKDFHSLPYVTAGICLSVNKKSKSYEQIFIKFSGNVKNGILSVSHRSLHFGDVPDARGVLTFDGPKIKGYFKLWPKVKRWFGSYKQTVNLSKPQTEQGDWWKSEAETSTGGAEMAALACLYQESADENILQRWFSLTCAIATNLSVLLTSLSNRRHNFLLSTNNYFGLAS